MRFAAAILAPAIALLASATVAQAEAVTTRIETRPYYGAISTIEHGVRVMRALPPHDRIIINPNGAARVSVNVGGAESSGPGPAQHSSTTNIYRPTGPANVGVGHSFSPSYLRRPHPVPPQPRMVPKH